MMYENERGASPIYIFNWLNLQPNWAEFSNWLGPLVQLDTTNNIYYIETWVLLPQITMEGLPHDFYMTNYIKDISEWRKNIFKGEHNKSTIEYLPKLQYFNTPS